MKALADYHIIRAECGYDFTVFLTGEGQLFATGSNEVGQLGIGDKESILLPYPIEGELTEKRVVDFACGGSHIIALCDSGEVYIWGLGMDGRLGLGNEEEHLFPTKLPYLCDKGITRVFAGGGHTFAVNDNDQRIWVWGFGQQGRLGLKHSENVLTPTLLDLPSFTKIITISGGIDHSIIVVE
jgi:alpha-tubulin suppressor-like RCC1 family protein